jgi:hypothetical protein
MSFSPCLFVALACAIHVSAFAQVASKRIRGDIVAVDGTKVQVVTRTGEKIDVKLDDKFTVNAVVPIDPAAIAPGAFVGAATLPQPDGGLRALEVLVFPESGRGSGEGHYAWDLQPGSMMTNATVAQVANVDKNRHITLKYKDGEKTITVPQGVPIVTFEPGDRNMLKPGAHVFFSAVPQADGSYTATRINVGKDGLVPPM